MIIVEFLQGETFDEIKKVLSSIKGYSFTLLDKSTWHRDEKYYIAFKGAKNGG